VILPNLIRLLGGENNLTNNLSDKNILDLGCGSGYFSNILAKAGANIIGIDLGNDLIKLAKENSKQTQPQISAKGEEKIAKYFVGNAESFTSITDIKKILTYPTPSQGRDKIQFQDCFDFIICVLAIQNIEKVDLVLKECKKVLNKNGKIIFIINHPAFRIAKYSD